MIEHGRISPPPNSVPTSSLPLSFLDIPWMWPIFVQRVFFYEFTHPNPDDFVPALKSSLSIALENFYPFAAKIVVPPLPREPQIVYTDGDSVPFTVAESTLNFNELTSNDPQDVKLLTSMVPQQPQWRVSEEGIYTMTPLLAVQVTLFPNSGICLGLTYNHTVCDGSGFQNFMKSWASICRTGEIAGSLPFLDRAIIEDPAGDLKTTFLKLWWDVGPSKDANPNSPCRIRAEQRATFVFSKNTINRLKSWITNRSTILGLEPLKISSFAAVYAFTWVCIVKSTSEQVQLPPFKDDTDHISQLGFLADCRRRLKTPLPELYFGNCLVGRGVAIEKEVLLGQDGAVIAANAIARKVKELENGVGSYKPFFQAKNKK